MHIFLSLVGAGNKHELLNKVLLALLIHIDAFCLKLLESTIYNLDTALNNELSGVNLSLGLLNYQETLSHLSRVRNLHNFHALNLDPTNISSIL